MSCSAAKCTNVQVVIDYFAQEILTLLGQNDKIDSVISIYLPLCTYMDRQDGVRKYHMSCSAAKCTNGQVVIDYFAQEILTLLGQNDKFDSVISI